MEKIPLPPPDPVNRFQRLRRIVRFTDKYEQLILFTQRHRKLLFTLVILGFGLPVFLIPTTIDRNKPYSEYYNRIFSSEFFLQAKPWIDK